MVNKVNNIYKFFIIFRECVSFTGLNLREAINHILNNAGNK